MKCLLHGGAANVADETLRTLKQEAAERSARSLPSGLNALDLVEQAVAAMELEPYLNAGYGSVIQLDGRIRMDAGICTSTGKYGAVVQIEHVANPIRVARKLMDAGYHSILSGDGATAFARECGFESRSPFTKERLEEYYAVRADIPKLSYAELSRDVTATNNKKLSTVGAVAVDDNGFLAAACSTGGTKYCYPGRVGDTPIFGAGVYCSEHVAVACTGEGDKVLRRLTSRKVEDFYLESGDLQIAVERALADLQERENGIGGLIAVSAKGEAAHAHTTGFMSFTSV
ncbi:MAG: hypothetical protein EOM26_07345 [Alphaproteobacteria bacterium]|nr:hypothetical protein [Alphaproteobacteria bacterium]